MMEESDSIQKNGDAAFQGKDLEDALEEQAEKKGERHEETGGRMKELLNCCWRISY